MPFSSLLLNPLTVGSIFLNPIDFDAGQPPERPPRLIHCSHSRETMRTTLGRFFWPSLRLSWTVSRPMAAEALRQPDAGDGRWPQIAAEAAGGVWAGKWTDALAGCQRASPPLLQRGGGR